VLAAERVRKPVVDHRVECLRVAHPVAEAGLLEQVGRARHRRHPAADADLEVAGADRLVEDADAADAARADLVDGLRRNLLRDAALYLRLAARDLALARLEHLAEDDVLDLLALYLCALERRLDRLPAEVSCVEGGEAAADLPERGARGADDRGLGHLRLVA